MCLKAPLRLHRPLKEPGTEARLHALKQVRDPTRRMDDWINRGWLF
jgi:hypothetical protein